MNMGLGGAMFYSMDNDDFNERCFQERFPLLKAINYQLNQKIHFEYPESKVVYDERRAMQEEKNLHNIMRDYFKHLKSPVSQGEYHIG